MKGLWDKFVDSCDAQCMVYSLTVAVFMAFSPLLMGLQVPAVFLIDRFWKINKVFVFGFSYTVDNPLLTMIPIMVGEYFMGYLVMYKMAGIDLAVYNPAILERITRKISGYLQPYLGEINFSLWYYIIGSLIISCVASLITYYIAKYRFITSAQNTHENHRPK